MASESEDEASGSGSYYETSSGEEDEQDQEEEDEEEDEPVLKYGRFAKDVVNSLSQMVPSGVEGEPKNVIVCMAVHPKFIALGTYDGTVKLLDHSGTVLTDREYHLHIAQINHISVDQEGDFIACCSDDGKVSIIGLFTAKYNNTIVFERAVKSVAIHPHFGKSANRVLAVGLDKLLLVEERRWPLIGYKHNEIHSGYGVIDHIKWRDNFIAWSNEKAVFVYDVFSKDMIACIKFEEESTTYLPCSLCWVKNGVLLVGRGHIVKVGEIRESTEEADMDYSGGVEPHFKKKKKMAIIAQNTFPEFLICGVVPIISADSRDGWNMVVLGYDANINQEEAIHNGSVPAPHLVVIPPGMYSPENQEFEAATEIARDKLLPRGHSYCRCAEYHLECVMTGDEDRFYVLTPIDIILAQKTDANDHVDWLIERKHFKEAMTYAENPNNARLLKIGKLQEAGLAFVYYLMRKKLFEEAARKCSNVLGPNDAKRWEDIIYNFMHNGYLPAILPYVPKKKPQLGQYIYEMILNHFLMNDPEELYKVIQEWPPSLYDPAVIMNAVSDQLKKQPHNISLRKVKAKLYEDSGDPDNALEIYLTLGDTEVFGLIRKKKLHNALIENLEYLMKLGEEQLSETVLLLVEFRHDDAIPPSKVVNRLESLKDSEYFLHRYLDTLFEKDPKAGSAYHERQVQLYADYDEQKLLPFLRACNDIPLQKALDICNNKKLYEAMVFLLDRMGNPKAALETIVGKLNKVDQAILFVRERDDEELWDTLIHLSRNLPHFITGLLQNAGTHIDPTKLIKEIPNQLEIENLGLSLVKLLNDYQLQVNLREGCKKILVKDSHSLMEKLHKLHHKATDFDRGATCFNCSRELSAGDDKTDLVMFFCGHMYHQNCVSHKNEMDICHLCYRSSNNKLNLRQPLHT